MSREYLIDPDDWGKKTYEEKIQWYETQLSLLNKEKTTIEHSIERVTKAFISFSKHALGKSLRLSE